MKTTSQLSGALQRAFERPTGGVVDLVEDLLRLCPAQGIQLGWHGDHCRVCFLEDGSEEILDRPLAKSVFRAMLARVACLCNERAPNSVSPYGGQGELLVGAEPPVIVQVRFSNTADDQNLELKPLAGPSPAPR